MDGTPAHVTPLPDGPYRLEGTIAILDADGRPVAARSSPLHLCRCGHSADKPFCDGSHARLGWTDDA